MEKRKHIVVIGAGTTNKAVVMLNWTWSYFSFSSALRLILRPSRFPDKTFDCDDKAR